MKVSKELLEDDPNHAADDITLEILRSYYRTILEEFNNIPPYPSLFTNSPPVPPTLKQRLALRVYDFRCRLGEWILPYDPWEYR